MNHYYDAYDKRYQIIHKKGYSWSSDTPTPIVLNTLQKYSVSKDSFILEIGCGEGRDARYLLDMVRRFDDEFVEFIEFYFC